MRVWGAAAVLVLLVLTAFLPPAAAHGEGVHHGALFQGTVAPGSEVSRPLEFEGGMLIGGWVFMLGAKVQGGDLDAELSVGSGIARTWTIPATDGWVTTMLLPETGSYNLTLRNSGAATVTFAIYFDQSCNCFGKFIPAEIPTGMVIFNTDTTGPSTVFAQLNEPKGMALKVSAALLTNARALWPQDFQILAVSDAPVERRAGAYADPVLLHELSVSVSSAVRVYFFVEGISLKIANPLPSDLLITPAYDITAPSQSGNSSLWESGVALVVAGLVVAAGMLLWRNRQKRLVVRETRKKGSKKGATRRGGGRGGRRTRTSQSRRRRR